MCVKIIKDMYYEVKKVIKHPLNSHNRLRSQYTINIAKGAYQCKQTLFLDIYSWIQML